VTARSLGLLLIALGTFIVLAVVVAGRDRVATRPVQAALAGAGVAVACGGLLVHGDAGAADWVIAVGAAAYAFPLHLRLAFRGDL
jgi:hypothetical protein